MNPITNLENQIITGDCIEIMNAIPEKSFDLLFADPPYNLQLSNNDLWRPDQTLVDAVNDDWDKYDSFAEYDEFTRNWLTAARRIMKPNGSLWVMGSYHNVHRVGTILQDLGYWILNEVTWIKCLGECTQVYAKTDKHGPRPIALRDLLESKPEWVHLWNGQKWTDVLDWNITQSSDGIELHLRSGEKIRCTKTHRWPTERGLLTSDELVVGDVLQHTILPEPDVVRGSSLNDPDVAWFIGLYLAEGSRHDGTISISSHIDEIERFNRLRLISEKFHGECQWYSYRGNGMSINLHGNVLNGILDLYVGGRTAKTKYLSNKAWQQPNAFLQSVLEGYLSGDGHYDAENDRWRLGFTQNRALETTLRTIGARLGIQLRIKDARGKYKHKDYEMHRGETRWIKSTHFATKSDYEIVDIKTANTTRYVELSVLDEPHVFALASGVLTHNSNPTPQMKGVRFCNAHETLLWAVLNKKVKNYTFHYNELKAANEDKQMRSDWYIPICSGSERIKDENGDKAHSTQKPEALLRRIINATSNPGDLIFDPFIGSGTTASVAKQLGRKYFGCDLDQSYVDMSIKRVNAAPDIYVPSETKVLIGTTPAKRLPFLTLVDLGYLPSTSLRLTHEKIYHLAEVLPNGTINYIGSKPITPPLNDPTEGFAKCGTTICGSIHQVGKQLLKFPSCNGWTTWEYFDPATQNWHLLNDLRQKAIHEMEQAHDE